MLAWFINVVMYGMQSIGLHRHVTMILCHLSKAEKSQFFLTDFYLEDLWYLAQKQLQICLLND